MFSTPGQAAEAAIASLAGLVEQADDVIRTLVAGDGLAHASEQQVVEVLTTAGALHRRVDGAIVEAVDQVATRSTAGDRSMRMTSHYGSHNVSELVQRTTLASPQTAARWQRAARAVRRERSLVTGELQPAVLPELREAMVDGDVGADGLVAAASPLADLARRADRSALLAADQALAAAARGEGPDGAPPACADLLRVQATAWAMVLDPDGAEPRDRLAQHRREVTLGTPGERDGLVPLRGRLLPEVAAQLQRIFDALLAPRAGVQFRPEETVLEDNDPYSDADHVLDDRRRPQRQHDALASALTAAARSADMPTIGGAAPTLVVSVRESDLLSGTGWAHSADTVSPISLTAARAVGCCGVIQRVAFGDDGRILRLGTEERVFNRHQRRAIALRDGGCLIPGCGVPAGWCEIHHVEEHAIGGPTHTDNGVMLCFWHHRNLESSGWRVRMNAGAPEVLAPAWSDPFQRRWRRVTKSPTRLAGQIPGRGDVGACRRSAHAHDQRMQTISAHPSSTRAPA